VVEKIDRLIIPPDYHPTLSVRETEAAIKKIKDFFETALAAGVELKQGFCASFCKT